MRSRSDRLRGAALLLSLALPAAGCGDLLSGGQKEIDLFATAGGGQTDSGNVTGTVSFEFELALVDEDGGIVPATLSPTTGRVTIESRDSVRVAAPRVDPRGYTQLRLVFRHVEADVTGGLQVQGVPVLGNVQVDIAPGDSLVVEIAVQMGIAARAREIVTLDLRAGVWLPEVDVLTRRVPTASFAAALDARHH